MSRIGFIGLGIMGNPMACNMVKKGSEVWVYDTDPAAIARAAAHGARAAVLSEIGSACDVVFTVLPNGEIVQDVLFRPDGVAAHLKPGSVVIDLSSVTPVDSHFCSRKLAESGVAFLDAPVSGGEPKAIDGTLSFMVGGDETVFNRVRPLLLQMGASAVRVGGVGSGSVTKLVNQIIVNLTIATVGEAMVFAAKAGVDPDRVHQAIRGGLAGSTVLDAKAPMMMDRDFRPGGKLSINYKDIKNVLATAHELNIPVPFSAQLFEIMQGLKIQGQMDEDHSSLVKHFERLAQVEVHRYAACNSPETAVLEPLPLSALSRFPAVDHEAVRLELTHALAGLGRKIVVLDDDPTGVQTVHDISVYTTWDKAAIRAGFDEESPIFFILTNSRGFTCEETARVHAEIGRTLVEVARETGRDFVLISRSDSTMRGHYPIETETLRRAIEQTSGTRFDGEIICPFFKEGGRFTIDNVHYVREGEQLTPAGQTEFARDLSFGYRSSHIGDYVAEKTNGRFPRESCTYIALDDLRARRVDAITSQLLAVTGFNKVIVNAIDYVDVMVFALAFCQAVRQGKRFMFRSAAAMTKVLGGVTDQPLLTRDQLIAADSRNGGIVLIGSHVNKTTRQFEALHDSAQPLRFIEFNQHLVLVENGLEGEVERVVDEAERQIRSGRSVVVYTRRERFDLDTDDQDRQLQVSTQISDAVTSVIGRLDVQPNFIIAKGGITSSDVGTKALGVRKACVMGQIRPGVPVWMTGAESKFPQMPYIIFPGNVGEVDTLREIVDLLA